MVYRKFGSTDLNLSLMGLGCMRFPERENGTIDEAKAEELVDIAYESGINYYDTAYLYNDGESERITAKALKKYPRDTYYFATKIPGWQCSNEQEVRMLVDEQLRRCEMDYFDFYLCHSVTEDLIGYYTRDFMIPALERLKSEGKIRYLGFSSHGGPDMLQEFAGKYDWDFAQIQLNYLDWSHQDAKRQYEILTGMGLPVMVMEPVRGGRLADLGESANRVFKQADPNAGIASWAMRYAGSLPGVNVVLSGVSSAEQIRENIAVMSDLKPITPEEQKVIDRAVAALKGEAIAPCTGCGYCVSACPKGLNVRSLMELYNKYSLSRSAFDLSDVRSLPQKDRPLNCVGCGACAEHCPQKIDIPAAMAFLAYEADNGPM